MNDPDKRLRKRKRADSVEPETAAAQAAGSIRIRDFIWFELRDADTQAPFEYGFWSDVTQQTANVVDPITGAVQARTFEGAGELIGISPITLS